MSFVLPPVAIDPGTLGIAPCMNGVNGGQVTSGPFYYGGNLYIVLQTGSFGSRGADVFKSTDFGLTWAAVDSGNCLAGLSWACDFDVATGTIRLVYSTLQGYAFDVIHIQDFDCGTEHVERSIRNQHIHDGDGDRILLSRKRRSVMCLCREQWGPRLSLVACRNI